MAEQTAPIATGTRRQRGELLRRISEWVDVPLSILGLVMLGLIVVEMLVELGPTASSRIAQAQTAIWAIFAANFVVEFAIAPSKLRYLKRNWLTVISVILPAFRAVRILRVARALRGIRLVRVLTTLNRGARSLGHIARRGQLGYLLLLTAAVTITAAAAVYFFERGTPDAPITSPGDALWWAATIVTTINSNLEVTTLESRIVGLLLRVFGVAIIGYLTATIAVYLLGDRAAAQQSGEAEIRQLRSEVTRLREVIETRLAAPAVAYEAVDDRADETGDAQRPG